MSGAPDGASVYAPAAFRRSLLGFLVADLALLGAWSAMTVPLLDGFGASLVPLALGVPLAVAYWVHAPVRRTVLGALRLDLRAVLCASLVFAVAAFAVVATRLPGAMLAAAPQATTVAHGGAVDAVVATPDDAARDAVAAALPAVGSAPGGPEEAAPLALLLDDVLEARRADGMLGSLGSPIRVAAVELDLARASHFGGDAWASGLSDGVTLPPDGMLLGPVVASAIGARVGDRVLLDVGASATALVVSGILPDRGFGTLDPLPSTGRDQATSPSGVVVGPVLVAPGAFASIGTPGIPLLLLSATGDAAIGKGRAAMLTEAVRRLPSTRAPGVSVVEPGASIRASVRARLAAARDDLDRAGLVAVVAAIVGSISAAVGLAHRRRTSVRVLRDLGMARADVVSALAVECWVAALVGVMAGSSIAGLLARRAVRASASAIDVIAGPVSPSLVRWAATVFVGAALASTVSLVASMPRPGAHAVEPTDGQGTRRRSLTRVLLSWTARNARVLVVVFVVGVPLAAARARMMQLTGAVSVLRDLALPFAVAGVVALLAIVVLWSPLRPTSDALRATGRRTRPFAATMSFAVGATAVVAVLLGSRAALLLGQLSRRR